MTIKEVAQMAGVSPAAVSRYFNGGSLGADKQSRIREVVEKTGFHPNPLAKTMRTGRSGQIGVIVPKILSDSVTRILKGISDVIRRENIIMILGCTEHDEEQEIRLLSAMEENHVDGIILMGRTLPDELERAIISCSVPVVVTGQHFEGVPCIYHDDFSAMESLTAAVLAEGRTNPAYIGAPEEDAQAGRARREGFESALRKYGLKAEKIPFRTADFSAEEGMEAMQQILSEAPETDAVICASDYVALGAMKVLREAGKDIPDDVVLTGFGDSWPGTLTDPPLTTVHLNYEECGALSAQLLMGLIRGTAAKAGAAAEKLGYEIVWRTSHGAGTGGRQQDVPGSALGDIPQKRNRKIGIVQH